MGGNIIFNKVISAEKIFEIENSCIIDLRSESEFKNGSIFGAINLPLLNDYEREKVGYAYINESTHVAKKLGFRYVGRKLEHIFDKISYEFSFNKNIIFFCARGGMRSGTVHNLFNSIGIKNYRIDKGYKGYRRFLLNHFPQIINNINFIVLHGKTGIGKTKILNQLESLGYPVLDLEFAANHRASFLGGVNLGEQNSQKQFETIIFHKIMDIIQGDKYKKFLNGEKINVFVEGESKRIGKIILPEYVFSAMNNGIHIFADLPIEIRIRNLIEDYFKVDIVDNENYVVDEKILDDFKQNLLMLKKYSTNDDMKKYFELFDSKKFEQLASVLMENYYDPKYLNSMNKHEFKFRFDFCSNEKFLDEMVKLYNNL